MNNKYLSLPPHISVRWKDVRSLHMHEGQLVVSLIDGDSITLPLLPSTDIEKIYSLHQTHLEQADEELSDTNPASESVQGLFGLDQNKLGNLPFGITSLDHLGSVMQHDGNQMNAPDLPQPILEKIGRVAQALGPTDPDQLPKAEPHCNCIHCQIARTINAEIEEESEEETTHDIEDEISTAELSFENWIIQKENEQFYTVTDPDDQQQQFRVFLGNPVGCTCGKKDCDHLLAVLRS